MMIHIYWSSVHAPLWDWGNDDVPQMVQDYSFADALPFMETCLNFHQDPLYSTLDIQPIRSLYEGDDQSLTYICPKFQCFLV